MKKQRIMPCPFCKRSFRRFGDLEKHVNDSHKNKKLPDCLKTYWAVVEE